MMNARTASAGDTDLVRTTTRRIAWQTSITCALMAVILAVLPFVLEPVLDQGGGDDDGTNGSLLVPWIIGIGIGVGGLVGVVVTRLAVVPLRHALALRRRVVAVTAHELTTPLTVLHTRAQLLAHRVKAERPRATADQPAAERLQVQQVVDDMMERP